jgi:hypothetical protein
MSLVAYDPNVQAFLIEHGASANGAQQFIGNMLISDSGDREKIHEIMVRLWLTLDKPLPPRISKAAFNPKGKGFR